MDERIAALAKHRYISLTTYRRDGRAVSTPVWFAIDGDRILVWCDKISGKAKRIRATKRAAVAPSDTRGKTTIEPWPAIGSVVPDDGFPHAHQLLKKKYSLLKPLVDLANSVALFIRRKPHPDEMFLSIELDPPPA